MGCKNQVHWLSANREIIRGPVLEVGSRREGGTGLRLLFPTFDWFGVDMQDGEGVDAVVDMTEDIAVIDRTVPCHWFSTIICLSVLEHCAKPWTMAQNIITLMPKGGLLFISVPFAWKLHEYPKDYWRFTPDGIRSLFGELDFDTHPGYFCSDIVGDAHKIKDCAGFPMIEPATEESGHHYVVPPTLVNMIGRMP